MKQNLPVLKLTQAALIAALAYVAFAYLKVPITLPSGKQTYLHIGNAFAALGALLIGGPWGGLAAGIGMSLGDLLNGDAIYAVSTVFLKLLIGLLTGLFAHHVFRVRECKDEEKTWIFVGLSCLIALGFNVIADPLVGFFRNKYILGLDTDISYISAKLSSWVTFVNSILCTFVATILYQALVPTLKRLGYLPELAAYKKKK